jgi:hypothetical protein
MTRRKSNGRFRPAADPLAYDLQGALRTVRLVFGGEQVTVLSLVPNSKAEAELVEADLRIAIDRVADQVLPYITATLFEED